MTEKEMQEIFREMRDEPVPVDSLARVRMGVANRIAKRSWRTAWTIAAALVLAGCVVGAFLSLRPAKPIPQVGTPEIAQVMPEPAAAPVESPEVPVPTAARPRRIHRTQRVETVPVSIRIETPDPDVVILLVN